VNKVHRIYMVPSPHLCYALVSGHEEAPELPPGRKPGLIMRFRSWYYRWTESALAQERALKKARSAESVIVFHPAQLGPEEARRTFEKRLREEVRRNLMWTFIDIPLLVPAVLAAFFPGPNVFFVLWAVRILGHYHAWQGGKRLLEADFIQFHPSEALGEWHQVLREKLYEKWDRAMGRVEKLTGIHDVRGIILRKQDRPEDDPNRGCPPPTQHPPPPSSSASPPGAPPPSPRD